MSASKKIRIVELEGRNFMRLKAWHVMVDPEKGLIRVTGKNRAGKTTLLRSIAADLGGASAVPDQPIREGADPKEGSYSKMSLSNGWSIERRFTPATPKGSLHVVSPDGGKYGQKKLDEWVGARSFDLLALYQLSRAKLRDVFLSLARDPDLKEKLTALEERRQEFYEGRTEYIVLKRDGNKVPQPEGERPAPIDTSAEMKRLEKLQTQQEARADLHRRITEGKRVVAEQKGEVARLERELEAARTKLNGASTLLSNLDNRLTKAPDVSEEIAAVRATISDADAVAAELERWRRWDDAQEGLAVATERERELTGLISAVDAEKDRLLAQAGLPVRGLSFDAEGNPLLNGVPLEQASGAERIQVAVEVAFAANPDLGICLVDEANDLDTESLLELERLAAEHDFQIWACRLGLDGAGEIVVEDGEATSTAVPA